MVKIRDGQHTFRPSYGAVTVHGTRAIGGWWAGAGGAGATCWLGAPAETGTCGVDDGCLGVYGGLPGLPASVTPAWPDAVVPTCLIHLVRTTVRDASGKHWDHLGKDLKPIYTTPTEDATAARCDECTDRGGSRYPAITRLRRAAWPQVLSFPDDDVEIRQAICSTDAIESLGARYRRAVRPWAHPTARAVLAASISSSAAWTHRPGQGTLGPPRQARPQRFRRHL